MAEQVPNPGLGSAALQAKVAEIVKSAAVAVVDEFTGKKICHRMYIPIAVPTPKQGLKPGVTEIVVNSQIANVPCAGDKCAMWNKDQKECFDVSAVKAQIKSAHVMEQMDAHNRMHTHEG